MQRTSRTVTLCAMLVASLTLVLVHNTAAADDPLPFRLVWADSIRVERLPDGFRVRCLEGEVALAPWALELLAQPGPPRPAGALLEALASRVAAALPGRAPVTGELRALLDALLEARVLRLEPSLEPTIAAPAGA